MFSERRKSQRVHFHQEVTIIKANGTHFQCKADNLSIGGLALKTEESLFSGERVLVRFNVFNPAQNHYFEAELMCNVSHAVKLTHPEGMSMIGLQFQKIDRATNKSLRAFIDHLAAGKYQRAS